MHGNASTCLNSFRRTLTTSALGLGLWIVPSMLAQERAVLCVANDPLAKHEAAGDTARGMDTLPHGESLGGGGDFVLLRRNPPWPAGTDHLWIRTSGGYLTADDFVFAQSTPLVAARMFFGPSNFATDPDDVGSEFYLQIWNDDGTGQGPATPPDFPPVFISGPHNPGDGILSINTFETDDFGADTILGATFNFGAEFFIAEPGTKYWIGMTGQPATSQSCLGVATSNIPISSLEPMVQFGVITSGPVYVGDPPQFADMAMELFGFVENGGATVLKLSGVSEGGCTVRVTPTSEPVTECDTGNCDTDPLFGANCYSEASLPPGLGPNEIAIALALGFANTPGPCNNVIEAQPAGPRLIVTTNEGRKPKLCVSINGAPIGIVGGPNQCMGDGCGYHFRIGNGSCKSPSIRPGTDTFATPPTDCDLDIEDVNGTWVEIDVPGAMFDQPGLPPANAINERARMSGVARDFALDDSDMASVRTDRFTFRGCTGDFSRPGGPPGVFSPDGVIDIHDIDAFAVCNGQTEPFEADCAFFDYNDDNVIDEDDLFVLLCLQVSGGSLECCPCTLALPRPADRAVPTELTRRHLRGCEYLEITRDGMQWPENWVVDYYLSDHEPSAGANDIGPCEPGDDEGTNGNNVIATANNLGLLTKGDPLQIGGIIGDWQGCDSVPMWFGDHDADVYRFSLGFDRDVQLRADALAGVDCLCNSGQHGIASLWLYDKRGDLLIHDDPVGAADPVLRVTLLSGEYYLLVTAAGQTSAPHPNGLSFSPLCSIASAPEVDGGDTDPTGCYDLHLAVLPRSEMSIVQETNIGGSFASRLLVQPLISFQKVADPFHAVLIDTGDIGTDATVLEATGHYVFELDNDSDVIPGDANFVPGVRDDGGTQSIEPIQYEAIASNQAAHRVTPARERPCDPLPGGGEFEARVLGDMAVGTWHVNNDGVTVVTIDSTDCTAGGSVASGVGYRLDPQRCIVNGYQPLQGDPTSDGLRWLSVGAPWEFFDDLDAGGAPQSALHVLFSQLGGISTQELACLTEDVPAVLTVDAVFSGFAAFGGSDVTGELHRLCNGAVVEIVDPEDALPERLHVRGVRWTNGSATFIADVTPDSGPRIVCGTGEEGETQPCCGYIDPRGLNSNGSDLDTGLTSALLRFDRPVFKCDGSEVDTSSFTVMETGGGTPPSITSATYVGGDQAYVEVVWDRSITLQEWTTIIAVDICDADGTPIKSNGDLGPGVIEPDRVDYGFLPADVDQSGCVTPFDLLKFRQFVNDVVTPNCPKIDFVDFNRNNAIDPFDLLMFRQLATRWAGECINNPQP